MSIRIGIGLGPIPTAARPAATTAPVNVVKPFFAGILTQGQSANVNPGSWTGLPAANFTYAIKRGATTVSTDPAYVWTSADVAAGVSAMTVAVTATNDIGPTTVTSDPVTIAPPLQISGAPEVASVGSAYSFIPTRTGGHGPFSFMLTGTLPSGLNFSTSTGAITGSPVSSGTAALSIAVADTDGLTASMGSINLVVSAVLPISIRFGALTPAGFGGYPVSGTAVSSGDSSGHFQVVAGKLTPSSAGAVAAMSGGPYSLIMDDGQAISVNIVPGAYHVFAVTGAQDEWDGASGIAKKTQAVLAGKTIFLRAGSQFASNITGATGTPFRRMSFGTSGTGWTGLTIESDDFANPAIFTDTWSNVTFQYVTLRGVKFPQVAAAKIILQGSATYPVSDIWVDNNVLNGVTRGWTAADYPTVATFATHFGNATAINGNGTAFNSNIRITGNEIRFTSGVNLGAVSPVAAGVNGTPGGNMIAEPICISGNLVDVYWALGIVVSYGGADSLAVVEDNVVSRCVSISDDAGNPHQDAIYFKGNSVATTPWHVRSNRNQVLKADGRGSPAPIACRDFIGAIGTMASISKANPGVVTLSAAPQQGLEMATGQRVRISTVTGMTELNGREFTLEVLTATTFNLRDAVTGVLVDTTSYGTFTGGGKNALVRMSGQNFVAEIIGNVVNCRSSEGILVQNAKDCVVLSNTVTKDDYPSTSKADIRIGGVIADGFTSAGTHRVERNIAESITAYGVTIDSSNVQMGVNAINHPYSTVFDGPTFAPTSRAQALMLLSRKTGGPADLSGGPPDAGAIGSGAIRWASTVPGSDGENFVS